MDITSNLLPQKSKKKYEKLYEQFMDWKVALIFGLMGACRRHELHDMKLVNVMDMETSILVTIPDTKTKTTRTFTLSQF
ncbi:hypothetical protein C0J52_07799 [Blattella germanica]|nr:hypothetical protein C0J52_07799 [Blattella germanica]